MKGLAKRNNKTRGKTVRRRKSRGKTIRKGKSRGGGDGLSGATASALTAEQLEQYDIQEKAAKHAAEAKGAKYTGPSASPGFRKNAAGELTKSPDRSYGRQSVFQGDMYAEGQSMDAENEMNDYKNAGLGFGGKKRKTHKKRK
jgi:hypothetical protein